jgi:hypothetical protein
MPRKANYPEWVTRHLKTGQYVNKKGDSYYIYSAHSERREGISHPVRVSDGYLGRITEKDGFIPAKKRGSPQTGQTVPLSFIPSAWNYGVPAAVLACTGNILSGLRKSYRAHGSFIFVCSILTFLYGSYSREMYQISVLSLLFPDISFPADTGDRTVSGIERGRKMITETVRKTYGEDWPLINAYLSTSVLTKSKKGYILPPLSPSAAKLAKKYCLPVTNEEMQKFLRDTLN